MIYPIRKLSILHVILAVRETSAPYNEHCLPWADKRDITISSYFRSEIAPPKKIKLYEGDGSLGKFIRNLRSALNDREYDVIHVHSPHVAFLYLLVALFSNRKFRLTPVVTVHDSYQDFKLRNRVMFIPVFAGFQRVVCCSRASYESFPALYKRIAGERLTIVQNGLDIARVDHVASNIYQRPHRTMDFTIIAISRLVEVKNPFTVLTAFKQSADETSRLIYLGDGRLRKSLIMRSMDTGFGNQIEFTGVIPREKVFEHLLNADLFISASRGEGLPIAVLEAMACRCPVLLSDIPPHREIADGADFIPVIEPNNVEGFAREIRKFREMPASERAAIGQKCRELVEERFSLTAMHAGYLKIYTQVMAKRAISTLEMVG